MSFSVVKAEFWFRNRTTAVVLNSERTLAIDALFDINRSISCWYFMARSNRNPNSICRLTNSAVLPLIKSFSRIWASNARFNLAYPDYSSTTYVSTIFYRVFLSFFGSFSSVRFGKWLIVSKNVSNKLPLNCRSRLIKLIFSTSI